MIRITGGTFRSRLIRTPAGTDKTRPLPDRVRIALFNLLRGHFEGQSFFDAFAGTGIFGLESLSRGGESCVFIEKDREVAALLRENIESLGLGDRARVFVGDALGAGALAQCPRPVHLAFFDPPYAMMRDELQRRRTLDQVSRAVALLDDDGFAILRTPWPLLDVEPDAKPTRDSPEASLAIPGAEGPETHAYGGTAVHLYMKKRSALPADQSVGPGPGAQAGDAAG